MDFFLRLVATVPRPTTLLDVGGTTGFWLGHVPEGFSLTLLNVFEQGAEGGMEILVGDGCDLRRFADRSFDIVFSNSVLCLVGGWERQQQMAQEIRRVGRRYFVQTANPGFPLDWRTLVPFFHWMPPAAQARCFQRMPVGRYKKARTAEEAWVWATRVRDLNCSQLQHLFPGGTIARERFFGITKSFMVHSGFEPVTNGSR
jgi:hypothetical protein